MAAVNRGMRGASWCVLAVAFGLLLLWPVAALAQPPLLAVAATALIGAGAIAGVTLTTVVFAGLTVSNLIFVSTMVYGVVKARSDQRKAARNARNAYNAGLTDRTASILSADNPWQIILGRATVGPAYVAVLTSGDKDQYKHVVAVWAAHQCDAIEDITIAGESIGSLDGSGNTTSGKWFKAETRTDYEVTTVSGAGVVTVAHPVARFHALGYSVGTGIDQVWTYLSAGDVTISGTTITINPALVSAWAGLSVEVNYDWITGSSNLRVRHYLGSPDQTADAALLAELPAEWTSSDRLRGLTYSVFRLNLNEPEFQGGPPQFRARIRGALVFDPRTDTTAWSNNAALCTAHYLRAEYGMRATEAQVLEAPLIIAANACDQTLVVGITNPPRYTCNGSFRTDADPGSVLDQLCQAMAGFATFTGAWHVQAGVYVSPTATLTDADNAGSIEVVAAPSGEDVFNGVRGRFFDPTRFDEMTDFPPYQNAAFKTEDGGVDLWAPLDLPFSDTAWRCHNLARIFTERSRGMQLVYPCKTRGLLLKVGQRVTLTNSFLSIDAEVFRIVKREFKLGQAVMLTLQQDDVNYWDTADAPASLPSPSQPGFDPFVVAAPDSLLATSNSTVTVFDDNGSVISRVLLTYQESPNALVQSGGALQIEYRLAEEENWQRAPEAPGDSTQTQLMGLKDARVYIIRARWRNGLGAVSDWSTNSVLTATPSAVGVVSVRIASTGLAFTFDGAGNPSPTSQTLTLEALLSNLSGIATFTATRYDSNGDSLGAATLGGTGTNVRTLSVAAFGSAAYCVVSAERSGFTDQVTLFRLTSGGISRAVIYIYRRDTSTPALPSATVTYEFATNLITGLNNGWSPTVPTGTDALYLAVASAAGTDPTDTIAPAEWTAPVVFVPASIPGEDGANTATVFLFQRTTTNTPPSLPSAAVTYTFSVGALSGLTNGWTGSVPASGGGYLWVTTATAFSSSGSDSIPAIEWAAASLMARDGEAAAAGINTATVLIYRRDSSLPALPSATVTYTFASAAVTGLNNGWTTSVPSGTLPLWVSIASAVDVDAEDTIAAGEWTTPVVMAQDGAAGGNSATALLFQRATTATPPAVPADTLTYTFATAALSGALSGWAQSVPDVTGGAYLWITSATAFSSAATDTISTAEWAAPQQISIGPPGIATFVQSTPPTATGIGDLWFDTGLDNLLKRWNGSAWIAYALDTQALVDGAVIDVQAFSIAGPITCTNTTTLQRINIPAYETDTQVTVFATVNFEVTPGGSPVVWRSWVEVWFTSFVGGTGPLRRTAYNDTTGTTLPFTSSLSDKFDAFSGATSWIDLNADGQGAMGSATAISVSLVALVRKR